MVTVRPGITDLASIVFADEGEILKESKCPDLDYHQLIRPWKSRLALFTIDHSSLLLDIKIIFLTAMAIFWRKKSLSQVGRILISMGASSKLVQVASRKEKLIPHPPPGSEQIVLSRGPNKQFIKAHYCAVSCDQVAPVDDIIEGRAKGPLARLKRMNLLYDIIKYTSHNDGSLAIQQNPRVRMYQATWNAIWEKPLGYSRINWGIFATYNVVILIIYLWKWDITGAS